MDKVKKIGLIVLVVLNIMVLIGQIWPEHTPRFARLINISFLILTLLYLAYQILMISRKQKKS